MNQKRKKIHSSDVKSGTFIGVRLTEQSCKNLMQYALYIGLPKADILPPEELHVSVVYCKGKFPIIPYPTMDANGVAMHIYDVVKIGNAIALIGECAWLRNRVRLASALGLTSSFPGYIPHVSLIYNPDPDFKVAFLPKPKFDVYLGQEYVEPLK